MNPEDLPIQHFHGDHPPVETLAEQAEHIHGHAHHASHTHLAPEIYLNEEHPHHAIGLNERQTCCDDPEHHAHDALAPQLKEQPVCCDDPTHHHGHNSVSGHHTKEHSHEHKHTIDGKSDQFGVDPGHESGHTGAGQIHRKQDCCGADGHGHGNAHVHHEHDQPAAASKAEHYARHEVLEAPKQIYTEQTFADAAPYRRPEEAIRQAQLAETAELTVTRPVDNDQAETMQMHEVAARTELISTGADQSFTHEQPIASAASENETVAHSDIVLPPERVRHREAMRTETVSDVDETVGVVLSGDSESNEDTDPPEAPAAIVSHAEVFDEIELAETIASLEVIGIEPAVLPLPEAMQEPLLVKLNLGDQTVELLHMQAPAKAVITLHGGVDSRQTVASIEMAVETLAEAIGRRVDEVEKQIIAVVPERAQEIRKTVDALVALQALPTHERSLETVQKQCIHLLRLLGHESPAQTLATYIHQYGIGFTDELLARLLELIGQGRSFESLSISVTPLITTQPKYSASALGTLVLGLLRLRGYFVPARNFDWA